MPKKLHPENSMRIVPQRNAGDCGVAALAGYLSLDYAKVAAVALDVAPDYEKRGMTNRELTTIARRLGHPLKRIAVFSLLDGVGIADIHFLGKRIGHFAVFNRGLVLDVHLGEAVPVDVYITRERAKIKALYVLKP